MKQLLLTALFGGVLAGNLQAQAPAGRTAAALLELRAHGQRPTTNNFRRAQADFQRYPAGSWTTHQRTAYSNFTSNNLPRLVQLDSMNGSTLVVPLRRNRLRYNGLNQPLTDTTYAWTNLQRYIPIKAFSYSYNAQDSLAQEVEYTRNAAGTLVPFDRLTYTYDAGTRRRTQVLYESYDQSWSSYARDQYTYDAQGRVARIELLASILGGPFAAFSRVSYTYNAQGYLQQELTELVNAQNTYDNLFRRLFFYNAAGQRTAVQVDRWVRAAGAWQQYTQTVYAYDTDGNVTTETNQNFANGAYADINRYQYTYQRVLAVTGPQRLAAGLSVYPNPSAGTVHVSYQLPQAAVATLEVLDVLGRVVATPQPAQAQGTGPQQLTLRQGLPAGIYTVRVSAAGRSQTQRLLVR